MKPKVSIVRIVTVLTTLFLGVSCVAPAGYHYEPSPVVKSVLVAAATGITRGSMPHPGYRPGYPGGGYGGQQVIVQNSNGGYPLMHGGYGGGYGGGDPYAANYFRGYGGPTVNPQMRNSDGSPIYPYPYYPYPRRTP